MKENGSCFDAGKVVVCLCVGAHARGSDRWSCAAPATSDLLGADERAGDGRSAGHALHYRATLLVWGHTKEVTNVGLSKGGNHIVMWTVCYDGK